MSGDQGLSKREPILPPTYFLIALLVMVGVHFIYPAYRFIPAPWNLAGLLLLGTGLVILIVADQQFHRVGTTVKPHEKPSALLTDGVYKISRNPMYLGFVMVLLGVAVLLSSLPTLAVVPVFIALMEIKFIRLEEAMLARVFGQDWQDYIQNVRRWI